MKKDDLKLKKFKDARGHHRWHIVASNGRIIAESGEGYVNEADCDHAIGLLYDWFRSF